MDDGFAVKTIVEISLNSLQSYLHISTCLNILVETAACVINFFPQDLSYVAT